MTSYESIVPELYLTPESLELSPETRECVERLLSALQSDPAVSHWRFAIKECEPAMAVMALEPSQFRTVILCLIPFYQLQIRRESESGRSSACYRLEDWLILALRHKNCVDEHFLARITEVLTPTFSRCFRPIVKAYIGRLEKLHAKPGFSPAMQEKLTQYSADYHSLIIIYPEKECRTLLDRLAALIVIPDIGEPGPLFDDRVGCKEWFSHLRETLPRVEWPSRIENDMTAMPPASAKAWRDFWQHATLAKSSSPSQKWLKQAGELLAAIGPVFGTQAAVWVELMIANTPRGEQAFSERNTLLVKGLLWACSLGKPEELAVTIGNMVHFGYFKIASVGPRAMPVANAGLYALGQLGGVGIVQLSKLRARVKYDTGLRLIEKALSEAAGRQGISQDDLEEIAVPGYDLDDKGETAIRIGEYRSVIRLAGGKTVETRWLDEEGKPLKNVPAVVKQDFRPDLKEWQKQAAEIADVITGQIGRLEKSYLSQRHWRFADWRQRFLQHPLLGWLGRRLIWIFEAGEHVGHGLWLDGALTDAGGQPLGEIPDDAKVRLWHPVDASVHEIQQWRTLLQQREIVQPFRQAFREVYLLTPAEREAVTSSARFAGHVLKQFPLASLCREREWEYRLQGDWDGCNAPSRKLDAWNISVSLEINYNASLDSEKNPTGVHLYVQTGNVRFNRPLAEVPSVVFSEMMRDVDLFVGVCSIGVDPTLQGRIDHPALGRFLRESAESPLADSALIRRDILGNIISKLVIAPRCRFEGKYLVVEGDLRGYKIHLGSGNILMTPNDQYLCIVPDGKKASAAMEGLFLPFEGDLMLDVILSKALLLAADTKIKDESILRQINQAG